MAQITREHAEHIVSTNGWLSQVPAPARALILQNSLLMRFAAGEIVYRYGDPVGGIYGLVTGTVSVNAAPPDAMPRPIHLALPGAWTGEGCFMTGQPRRVELRALTETVAMHVPLDAMERLAANEPGIVRMFGIISILGIDMLVRVIHDLQKREGDRRIAAVLHRMYDTDGPSVSISQEGLGVMANTSRQQTNAALQKFVTAGWITTGYRAITVDDPVSLKRYSELPPGD